MKHLESRRMVKSTPSGNAEGVESDHEVDVTPPPHTGLLEGKSDLKSQRIFRQGHDIVERIGNVSPPHRDDL